MTRLTLSLILCTALVTALEWQRTRCGPADQVTQWGKLVDPANVLPEYPRPQFVREEGSWKNLNGIWEYQPGSAGEKPHFGSKLSGSILVPFPVESCLSGVGVTSKYLWYRLVFDRPSNFTEQETLLHFGSVDWQTTVWMNGQQVGTHTGGYDSFTFNVTEYLRSSANELLINVYDPSDEGFQPNGKQRISAITNPGGDTYTPASGIWQTVWLENVPRSYIVKAKILADMTGVSITPETSVPGTTVYFQVMESGKLVAKGQGLSGSTVRINVPNPKLWNPESPFLYDLIMTAHTDVVTSYFGMREVSLGEYEVAPTPATGPQIGVDRPGEDLPGYPVTLPRADYLLCESMCNTQRDCLAWAYAVPSCDGYAQPTCWLKGGFPAAYSNKCRVSGAKAMPGYKGRRPMINGKFTFLSGWLDQSFWPDGIYTAPTEDGLKFDLEVLQSFGLNTIRLHQKVNNERWYWHADRLGIVVLQDMVQKYGGATQATVAPFIEELKKMIHQVYNHPSIIQWEVFNEGDCVGQFNATEVTLMVVDMDPSRLVDTNSGGPANDLHVADVNDIHSYPWPGNPLPSATQYAMVGEFGGIGAFVQGKEWVAGKCTTYLHVDTPTEEVDTYLQMIQQVQSHRDTLSCVIYTQISDVELECDGFLNYDRTQKFTEAEIKKIAQANKALIRG